MIDPKDMKEFVEGYGAIAPTFLRDLFAGAAMKALLGDPAAREMCVLRVASDNARPGVNGWHQEMASDAYAVADAMLWAREVSAADNRAMKEGKVNG